MTEDVEQKREVEALKRGAADYIRKPLHAEILQNRVENVLMRYRMEYDALTGLYNRSKSFQMIRKMIQKHPGETFAFLRFDIDNFSIYNSSMGEKEGNRLLLTGAAMVKAMQKDRDACVYGRIDADVFCLCEIYDEKLVARHIDRTMECLNHYREDYRIEASFGIYVFQDPNISIEKVYTNASLAAHTCKGIYNKHYAYYEPWMHKKYSEEQDVVNEMVRALQEGQFVPYLQPKYDLESDEPCGAEALVRWIHPKKGIISPAKFIPVFEKNGFIAKLDYYMWEAVCKILHRWKQEKRRIYPISVNVSRISMHNPHLDEILAELVEKYELTPDLMELEITESAYMTNPDLMKETIHKLRAYGFVILMDDFGSGYSSLNTLKEIHVDILKVDMKFLPNGEGAARSEKILSSVIRMAGWLGIPTIAEGVETEHQRDFLRGIGCDYVQGFYYAKPMTVEEYEYLIAAGNLVLEKNAKMEFSSASWSSDEKVNEILTGIQLPVAIVEQSISLTEIIRTNLFFGSTFGKDFKNQLDETNKQILYDIIRIASVDGEAEGEFQYSMPSDGKRQKTLKIKVKCLEKTSTASLLCAILLDITNEKTYQNQLRKLEGLLPTQPKTKMLVVDDSETSQGLIRVMFEDSYDIISAENGKVALELLEQEKDNIAIILLDMIMPVMDGRAFLIEKRKLEDTNGIPVIVMSADTDSNLQLDMLEMGVNDYITKPFDNRIFKQKVENAIMFAERFVEIRKEYERVQSINEEDREGRNYDQTK